MKFSMIEVEKAPESKDEMIEILMGQMVLYKGLYETMKNSVRQSNRGIQRLSVCKAKQKKIIDEQEAVIAVMKNQLRFQKDYIKSVCDRLADYERQKEVAA